MDVLSQLLSCGRAMAQAANHWPLTAEAEFIPGSVHAGFVVDKVALGQDFLQILQFSCQYHSPWPHTLYHLGDEQQANWWQQFRDSLTPLT